MTTNADFKRIIRARMQKTGESYTAARAQILSAPPSPREDEYADLAGMSDGAVRASTGKTWAEWAQALDAIGAAERTHAEIARSLSAQWPDLSGWWVQSVTVGYERIRGLRKLGQLCAGDFAASKSRTFPVPISRLFAAFADGPRSRWMGEAAVVRTATADRSMRLTWPDGTIVAAWFTDKGAAKSAVSIQHTKLDSAERREFEKERWGERLAALGQHLST